MRCAIATLLFALMLSACTGLGGEPLIVATVAAPTAESAIAPKSIDWQPDLENGERIFAERCTDCHGETGDGQGELVLAGSIGQPLDMTKRDLVSAKSPLAWFEIITRGRIENLMPPWENALSEAERWDVALYSYALSYDDALLGAGAALWREKCGGCEMPAVIAPVFSDVEYGARLNRERFAGALDADEIAAVVAYLRVESLNAGGSEPEAAPLVSVAGRIEHGTAGAEVPADTVVQLQYGNAESGFSFAETKTDADSSFSFADVPLTSEFSYVVSAAYQGRLFSRRLPSGSASDTTVKLYDLTTDPMVVKVSRIDLFVEAIRLADLGAGLFVTQVIGYQNNSDRIYTSGRRFDDGREAVLLVQFPVGARPMSGDDNGRYVIIENMENIPDSVIDTLPVAPGDSHQVILEYFLPYERDAQIEQAFNNVINADVSVTLGPGLQADGDYLQLEGDSATTEDLSVYSGRLQIESEPRLSLGISGDLFATSSDDQEVVTRENLPALLAGVGVIAAGLLAGFGILRRRRESAAGEIDRLVIELARLDEDHDQGLINHDLYHQRRELKARLADLMATDE